MELCIPDLKKLCYCEKRRLTEKEIGFLMRQTLLGTEFMHKRQIIHRYVNESY